MVEETDEDQCLVRITADSPDWAVLALGVAGSEFEILRPNIVAEHLRDWSDRFSRAAAWLS